MNSKTGLLLGIMIAQLVVIGTLLLLNGSSSASDEPLLALVPENVVAMELESGDESADDDARSITLTRGADGWSVGERMADDAKVTTLLERLAALGPGWPVATTAAAQERFAVADDIYRRRLVLTRKDGSNLTILFGTSPGFKRLHARRAGEDAIYSVALAEFDFPMKAADWLDKALLSLRGPVSAAERAGAFRAELGSTDEPVWRLTGENAAAEQIAATENVERWIDRFRELRVVAEVPSVAADKPVDRFLFSTADGAVRYELYHQSEEDQYSISRDDVAGRYEIPSYIALQMQAVYEAMLPSPAEEGRSPWPGIRRVHR